MILILTLITNYRRKELDEILELIPGTTEYKVRMIEEAANKKSQTPECPVILGVLKQEKRFICRGWQATYIQKSHYKQLIFSPFFITALIIFLFS